MALPSPLPDDPRKWDGWSHHGSRNFYERLCFSSETHPSNELIEEHSRQLLVWWQKKLPLRNQPSNPIAQLLWGGLDAAPRHIAEARAELLQPERRAEIDRALVEHRRHGALAEFQKFVDFALVRKVLTKDAEDNLFQLGRTLGLRGEDVSVSIRNGVINAGAVREAHSPPPSPEPQPASIVYQASANGPGRLTRRLLPRETLSAEEERHRYREFHNSVAAQMLLVTSGKFLMGSLSPEAPIDEQPATQVTQRLFYISRYPITNAQYELFDPDHAPWRSPQAGGTHPVVYVSHFDATRFCTWLSEREGKRYRLPTEAEWEYTARGTDGRVYPWAPALKAGLAKVTLLGGNGGHARGEPDGQGKVARFADGNTAVTAHDPNLDNGCVEASPVGLYPRGASPFGVEDLAGNVWEWCQDFYDTYKRVERTNPRGPQHGTQRVCRGGSWKSPFVSLKATTRGYNLPTYTGNDVGFRVVCECE